MKLSLQKKRSPTVHCLVITTVMLIFCLMFSLVSGNVRVRGSDEGQTTSGEEDTEGTIVTFTNTKNTSPDLYVTKSIQTSAEDESDYSDAEFTFTLSLDGSVARLREYTVWDESGNQVFLYEDGESTEVRSNAMAYLTSRYGVFTLKTGQTARFSDVGAGTFYEVEEEETDGFTQILPSGGANAVGTVTSEGTSAAFTNLVTTDTEQGKSGVKIYKTVSFPEGWTPAENPPFSFTIEVNGEALVLEDYEIYDADTGKFKKTGTTDADGHFTLYAGEYALFVTAANVDYRVTEHETEGWRITTDETVSGSTGESVRTVVFNNAAASFIVTKTLTAGSEETEDEFTFFLSDGTGTAMAGASWWLYDIYGNPQYNEEGELLSFMTGADGSFTLRAGQAAVFFGMEAGTQYSVFEAAAKGWNQITPVSAAGYIGKTVSDAVEILPFENAAVDLDGTLTVTKLVEAVNGLSAPTDDEFTFCLYNGNGDPVAGAVYAVRVGSEVYTWKTDTSGQFSIHAGETAVFSSLTYGLYSVKEITVPEREHETYGFSYVTIADGAKSTVCKEDGAFGTLDEDGLAFTYTNTYSAPSSLTIRKYRGDGSTPLSDVTFTLSDSDGNLIAEIATDDSGVACFAELNAGTYTVAETSTRDGYYALINSFTVTLPLTMTKDEAKAAGTDTSDAVWRSDTNLWYFFDVMYNITNSAVLDLPETGGSGWFVPVIMGAAILTTLTIAIFFFRKKKQKAAVQSIINAERDRERRKDRCVRRRR
ncbi:MAG: DUF5979 domain-containing protein [Lachnospiraceae bacterium]|nr:DUF5979 domain-containing protein [Lachnospiraceae bacterium]